MEPLQQRSLSDLQIAVRSLSAELKKQRGCLALAASHLESTPSQQAYGVMNSGKTNNEAEIRQAIAAASKNIQIIKERLFAIKANLHLRLKQWDNALWQFKNGITKVKEVTFIFKSYEEAQEVAHKQKQKIFEILNDIHAIMDFSQQATSGTIPSARQKDLEEITAAIKTASSSTSQSNCGPLSVTHATLDYLDAEIYQSSCYTMAREYNRRFEKEPMYRPREKPDPDEKYLPKTYYTAQLANHRLLQGKYFSRTGVYAR